MRACEQLELGVYGGEQLLSRGRIAGLRRFEQQRDGFAHDGSLRTRSILPQAALIRALAGSHMESPATSLTIRLRREAGLQEGSPPEVDLGAPARRYFPAS